MSFVDAAKTKELQPKLGFFNTTEVPHVLVFDTSVCRHSRI